ncbi:50S ribosomal protein L10 [Chryseobacterium koreense]|uniref:Large ribosomal subunit protein uL10 n=2 Tax=root TaxID=1 RepID=A0A0J7J0P9_9FLAO|nr:50S ribosomal protein L10 [Chryseobacterium koreense]KMQ71626.1 50S ribosomal protein L10 [Chryseobacterium koreense CCUG 49689]MBB5333253.1 large subunit ribosomal protein L10 [Chryseobacterium koreense]
MTKENKVVAIQEIKDLLQDAKVVYVADLEGLNAQKSSDFRRAAFKQNIKVKVVKNTLLQKAMEQIEGVDYSEMFETFKGNSAIMISETANAPAKLIRDFRKKEVKPALKSAFLQETFYVGDNNLEMLANIKSREEMIGEIIGLLQSPIQRVIGALQNKPETVEAKAEAAAEPVEAPVVEAEAPAEETAPETPEATAEGEAPAAE